MESLERYRGSAKRSVVCLRLPLLAAVPRNQYNTASRPCLFDAVSSPPYAEYQNLLSRPAPCFVLFEYSSKYGTACVPGAKTDVEVRIQT